MARVEQHASPWTDATAASVERAARNSATGFGSMDGVPTPDKTTRGALHYVPGAEDVLTPDVLVLPLRDNTGTIRNFYPLLSPSENIRIRDALTFIINGIGSTIPTGIHGDLSVPYGGVITGVRALGDQVGSISVDVWQDSFLHFPPTAFDSIGQVTISSDDSSEVTTWNVPFSAGDTFRFNVDSCSALTRCTLMLTVQRTL